MMGIANCRHCVDLEILVRAEGTSFLDWAPVSEARLSVVEPLIAQLSHVSSVHVRNSLSNFRARNTPV